MNRIFLLVAAVLLGISVTGCGLGADISASASPKNKQHTAATSAVSEMLPIKMGKSAPGKALADYPINKIPVLGAPNLHLRRGFLDGMKSQLALAVANHASSTTTQSAVEPTRALVTRSGYSVP